MPIDFPSSPSTNQTYTYGSQTWVYDGAVWNLVPPTVVGPTGPAGPTGPSTSPTTQTGPTGPPGRASTVGTTGPTAPEQGDLWYDTDDGTLFVYYNSAWVEAGSSSGMPIVVANTTERPAAPVQGTVVWRVDAGALEIYNGSAWETFTNQRLIANAAARPGAPTAGYKVFQTDTGLNYTYNGSAWRTEAQIWPGAIIERVSSMCDGSSVTVRSGTYTVQSVTALQDSNVDSYVDITGSTIAYVPPAEATRVEYQFEFACNWEGVGSHAISHYKFFIDNVEVVYARHNHSAVYDEDRNVFCWTIPIGGSADTNTGRQATWTSLKTLKMQYRPYGTAGNTQRLHSTYYWDGAGSTQFSMPRISVTAIA